METSVVQASSREALTGFRNADHFLLTIVCDRCQRRYSYQTIDDIPFTDVRCPCGRMIILYNNHQSLLESATSIGSRFGS